MGNNWGYERLHKLIEKRDVDEMKHAEKLIARILFLEGQPTVSILNKIHIDDAVPKMHNRGQCLYQFRHPARRPGSTIVCFHTTLLHHGMVVVGLPYAFAGQMGIAEITGCSPNGASTITGGQGERMPRENELAGARYQGAHVAGRLEA